MPEPSSSADAEAFLYGAVFLAVLLRCPDEGPNDDREREQADSGNHYPEDYAHGGRLDSVGRELARLGQCSGMTPEWGQCGSSQITQDVRVRAT